MKKEIYKNLVQKSGVPYAICSGIDKDKNKYVIVDVNEAFEQKFNLIKADIIGKDISIILKFEKKDGVLYDKYNAKYYKIHYFNLDENLIVNEYIDITKKVFYKLEKDEVMSSLNDIVLEFDEKHFLTRVLASEDNFLYSSRIEMLGKNIRDIYVKDKAEYFIKYLEQAKKTKKPINIEYQMEINKLNKWFFAKIKYFEVLKKEKYVVVISDITNLKAEQSRADYYEKELKSQLNLRNFLLGLSTKLVGAGSDEIKDVVNQSLKELGQYIKADRVYVFEYDFEKESATNTYEWVGEGISSKIKDLQNIGFKMIVPWVEMTKGEILYVPNVETMEENVVKERLSNRGVKTMVSFPLIFKNVCSGFVGFDYVKNTKKLTADERITLNEFANILMGVLSSANFEKILSENERKYRHLTENMVDVVWTSDLNFNISYVSPSLYNLTGYSAEEFKDPNIEKNFDKVSMELLKKIIFKEIGNFYRTKVSNPFTTEALIYNKKGFKVWVELKISFLIKNGKVHGLQGAGRDISLRKKALDELKVEKELFKTTLLAVGDAVITTNKTGEITLMNDVASRLTGYKKEEAIGNNCMSIFKTLDSKTLDSCEHSFREVFEEKRPIGPFDNTMLVSKDGTKILIEAVASPILNNKNDVEGIVLVFRDVTEKKKREEEILYLSYNDYLTTLNNRRFLEEQLIKYDIMENYPLTLVMMDVNGLKLINDAFGHFAGDSMLQKVATELKINSRPKDLIARVGGDEFVLVLPKTNSEEAREIVAFLSKRIEKEKVVDINLSISFGFETKEDLKTNMMDIFKKAESKMYKHKLQESQKMRSNTIDIIMKTLYEKNNTEEMHSKRVSALAGKIGTALGLLANEVGDLKNAGLMHDIGKIMVPDEILNSPNTLSEEEWLVVKKHPETGYKILSSINEFSGIALEVLQHHERWDGEGYPQRLKGNKIELNARIISVADAYDSMTSARPYNVKKTKEEAIAELNKYSGTQFDPNIVKVFIEKVLK